MSMIRECRVPAWRPNEQRRAAPRCAGTCEAFLVHEARLLDEGRFDEWLGLFTPDAWYWVPVATRSGQPARYCFLIYDDRRLLETRVRRLASPRIYSQEPRSRTSRIVANVTIEEIPTTAAALHRSLQVPVAGISQRHARGYSAARCFHRLVRTRAAAFKLPGNGSISSTATPRMKGLSCRFDVTSSS